MDAMPLPQLFFSPARPHPIKVSLAVSGQFDVMIWSMVEMATEFLNAFRFRPWFFLCCRVRPSVSVFFWAESKYVRHTDR